MPPTTTTTMTTPTDPSVQQAAALFAVLAHPGRLGVLSALHLHGPQSVSELTERLGVEQSAMSHQLRVLRDARLVAGDREGRTIRYRLDDHHVAHIVHDALAHTSEET